MLKFEIWLRVISVTMLLLALACAGSTHAAVLDVCATCTYTTLDSAFLAAGTNDTIILDGPDNDITAAPEVYTLTANLVIDDTKTGLEIRGDSSARPDQIQVVGVGAGPVITVEQDQTFEARGFTIMGGTTGILAMTDSTVEIRRCLIDGVGGIGVDCVSPADVYMAASVVTNCTSDAVRIDMGGALNITQCTFLNNTGLGVNAIAGVTHVVATMVHDCGAGMADGSGTALTIAGCYVTDAAGAVLATPVVDSYAFTQPLDTATAFETTNPFPGEFDDLYVDFPITGETYATLNTGLSVDFFARDFSNVARSNSNVVVGADERAIAAVAAAWVECYVVQMGRANNWVSEGPATIQIYTENFDLTNAQVWFGNPTQSLHTIADNTNVNRLLVGTLTVPSVVDANFGSINYTFDLNAMELAFPDIADVNTTDYEVYVQPTTAASPTTGVLDVDILDQPEASGSQAEVGRIFGFDTIPPRVNDFDPALADQYLAIPPTDGVLNALPMPPGWSNGQLQAGSQVGANLGFLQRTAGGEPSVFLNPDAGNPMDFTLNVNFVDDESGFLVTTASTPSNVPGIKDAVLFEDYRDTPSLAWWTRASEANELLNGPASLTATYTGAGANLNASWTFTGNVYNSVPVFSQWHASASIRVMDLAGNEAELRPFHVWWFPTVFAEFRGGPGGAETTNPVFTWGLDRFAGGRDPRDPYPCFPSARWRVWRAVSPGIGTTPWVDITDPDGPGPLLPGWSDWMDPSIRSITLDSYFRRGTTPITLRELLAASGGSEFLIAIVGYDEAGNIQPSLDPGGLWNLPNNLGDLGGLSFQRWMDPGTSTTLGLDTKVQPTYWYNRYDPMLPGFNRFLDPGERSLGANPQVPLPPNCASRVEAGFNITMEVPVSVLLSNARVAFQLFEDGRFVADGLIDPSAVPNGFTFVIPQDLLDPNFVGLTPDPMPATYLEFLNNSDCADTVFDRLGDDGVATAEPAPRRRDVKYQLLFATGVAGVYDQSPATVEFTVTVDRDLKDDQPIKSFVQD